MLPQSQASSPSNEDALGDNQMAPSQNPKTANPTPAIDHGEEVYKGDEPGAAKGTERRRKRSVSGVKPPKPANEDGLWEYFDFKEVEINPEDARVVVCKLCGESCAFDPKMQGTDHLWHHINNECKSSPQKNEDKKRKTLRGEKSKERALSIVQISKEECRRAISEYLVTNDRPFTHVESEGFKRLIRKIQPKLVPPSGLSICRDINQLFEDGKAVLKSTLKNERVSITTDMWTSVQNINYVVITAHWVDSQFNLQNRMINFCQISDLEGRAIGRTILTCLIHWDIQKMFGFTADSATSDEKTVACLSKRFKEKQGGLVLDGKFLHMKCCADIVTSIVTDELNERRALICSIRNAVRYVRSSESRLQDFKYCVKRAWIPCEGLLSLDVPTRWDSTYMMMVNAIKFQEAFESMNEDANYTHYFEKIENDGKKREGPPTELDWESAKVLVKFLQMFYEVTLKFSGFTYVTSNSYFTEMCGIQEELYSLAAETDETSLLGGMARGMKEKYDKYWGELLDINGALLLAVVLDPRYKLRYLKHCLSYFHDHATCIAKITHVEGNLRKLFDEYNKLHFGVKSTRTENVGQCLVPLGSGMGTRYKGRTLASYIQLRRDQIDGKIKNEVDRYLYEPLESISIDCDSFDILKWWKANSIKYSVLSLIARDVLALPVTAVASEAAFSTGGRVLDPFKSSLSPKMVEVVVCLKNWLSDSHEPIIVTDYMDEATVFEAPVNLALDMPDKFESPETGNSASSACSGSSANHLMM